MTPTLGHSASPPMVKLREVAEQVRGVTYTSAEASPTPFQGSVPVLRANNICDGRLVLEDIVHVPAKRVSSKQLLRQDDVVIAASSGSIAVVGKAARNDGTFEGSFGAFCKVLRPNHRVDGRYFAHFFQTASYRRRVSALAAGANINNLRNEHLDDLEFPLPPLAEQRRIAAILDQAEELRAKRRAAIALLDQLPQAIFLDMFGDPATNPKGWPLVEIGTLSDRVSTWDPARQLEEFSYIDIASVDQGIKQVTSVRKMSADAAPSRARQRVQKGDILVSTVRPNLNAVAVVPEIDDTATASTGFCVLRPIEELTTSEFLFTWVRMQHFVDEMMRSSTGASYPAVSDRIVRASTVFSVPIEEQLEFSARCSCAFQLGTQARQGLQHVHSLLEELSGSFFQGGGLA